MKSLRRKSKALSTIPAKDPAAEPPSSLQKAISNGDVKIQSVLRTSQALKQARPLSGKKTKKLERKARFDQKRKEEAAAKEEEERLVGKGEVEMKDVGGGAGVGRVRRGDVVEEMEVDEL